MKRITRYDLIAEAPPIQSERHNPLTIEAGVKIPALQSLAWAVPATIAAVLISALVHANINRIMIIAIIVFLVVFTAAWWQRERYWRWIAGLERITGMDLDNSGTVGDVPPREIKIRLQESPTHEEIYHLPEAQLQKLAGCIQQGYKLTERELAGRNKPFSLNEWKALRDELKRRGLMVEVSPKAPQQGYAWTAKGKAVMRGVMLDISPAPDADVMRNNDG